MWNYIRGSFFFWFGLLFTAIGTPFLIVALLTSVSGRAIDRGGVLATATLVEKGHESHPRQDSSYWLRYTFSDQNGRQHVRRVDVPWDEWTRHVDGDRLPIRYLADQPDQNHLVGYVDNQWWILPLIFGLLGFVFAGLGLTFVIVAARKILAELSLLRTGSLTQGEVVAYDADQTVTINGRHPEFFRYRYTVDSRKLTGRSPDLPLRLTGKWQPGDKIAVAYDPRDPSQSEPDIYNLRRSS